MEFPYQEVRVMGGTDGEPEPRECKRKKKTMTDKQELLLTDEKIKSLCVKYLTWDEPVSDRDLALVKPLFQAQLAKVKQHYDMLRIASLTLLVAEIQGCKDVDEVGKILKPWINANDLHPEEVKTFNSKEEVLKHYEATNG